MITIPYRITINYKTLKFSFDEFILRKERGRQNKQHYAQKRHSGSDETIVVSPPPAPFGPCPTNSYKNYYVYGATLY